MLFNFYLQKLNILNRRHKCDAFCEDNTVAICMETGANSRVDGGGFWYFQYARDRRAENTLLLYIPCSRS